MTFSDSDEHTREHELPARGQMWQSLLDRGGPTSVEPKVLRELGIYGGAQGIWVNQLKTGNHYYPGGITVAVLHTGKSYADDWSSDGVPYHYPSTARPAARDASEVAATKAAATLRLPVFVVTHSAGGRLRDVYRGYVEGFDDAGRLFLIAFTTEPPTELIAPPTPEAPLDLFDSTPPKTVTVTVAARSPRFKFETVQYYGPACAMCDVSLPALLDAAHIVSKKDGGADDPRNGLILCPLHHRAFDRGHVRVHPDTTALVTVPARLTLADVKVTRETLGHLISPPAVEALAWRWERPVQVDESTP